MSIELIRGELERLYSLEDMLTLSSALLGFEPEQVGGTASPASFARALADYCKQQDAIAALVDAITAQHADASSELPKYVEQVLRARVRLETGESIGRFTIGRKIGVGPNGSVYAAKEAVGTEDEPEERAVVLKLLHASAAHDRCGLHRFLTRQRLVAELDHENLPSGLTAGFVEETPFVAYEAVAGRPLASRIARTGALHINEARALLHGALQALAALHERGLVHGAIKLENLVVSKRSDGAPRAVLIDAGGDLLSSSWVHSDVATSGGDRIKGAAPEQLQFMNTTARSDLYSVGALLFEVLTGRPPLEAETASELAVAHLAHTPPDAREVAPKGWVSEELAELCARLLDKDPAKRPGSVTEVLEVIGPAGPLSSRAIGEEELEELIDNLVADPHDPEAAIALELTLDRGAESTAVAEAFRMAADEIDLEEEDAEAAADGESDAVADAKVEAARDRLRETKKGLLFRAARVYQTHVKDEKLAEDSYKLLLDIDPEDDVARSGFENALEAQDKLEELIEILVDRGENSESHSERARAFNKIGHLYLGPLDDLEQGVFAFAQALSQDVQNDSYATDLEKAAGDNMEYWVESMRTLHAVADHPSLPEEVRAALFMRLGNWHVDKTARPDLALPCFQTVLALDPAHQGALAGMTALYRRAQQWTELVSVLETRIGRAATPERGRDLRAEAAEILETRMSEPSRARDLYEEILEEDPAHQKAVEALGRIYQREDNHAGMVHVLERQADALTGAERAEVLCKTGEIHEDQLKDDQAAERAYHAALEIDPGGLTALRALDRLLSRGGRYQDLLGNLEAQVRLAATPRQKVSLYERIAGIHDEEFLDHGASAEALEKVLEVDSSHEGAITALMRHYRALNRWDDVVSLYERSLDLATEDDRRVELLLAMGRLLLDQIGSPERARQVYEKVLEIDPNHPAALELLASVREATGDAMAALSAVESLAKKATEADSKADLWMRAAKILEEHGDRDGAIERYRSALDAVPSHPDAMAALREAHLQRGDHASAAELLIREIEHTEGQLAQARLYCELAKLQRDKLDAAEKAKAAALKAIDLDSTSIDAPTLLADMAFDAESFLEASKHYATLASRVDVLPQDEGKRVLIRYIDSLARSGSTGEARNVVPALLELAPDDAPVLRRAARVRLDAADGAGAAELYQQLHERFSETLSEEDRTRTLLAWGKALRLAGDYDAALGPLHEAADLAPDSLEVIDELCSTLAAQENWEELVRIKKQRLDLVEGEQRSALLLEIGEVLATHIKDPTRAAKSLVAALEERPDDRKVLARLMKLYSEEKDWGKLVEVVLKLAEGVEDSLQKAKYIQTAAVVSAQQIGDLDGAIGYLDQVLELDPGNEKALGQAIDLREQAGDFEGVVEFLQLAIERAEARADRAKVLEHLDRIAEMYEQKLGLTAEAVLTLERAQEIEPGDDARAEKLARLYASDVEVYLEKAIESQMQPIRKDPFNAEPYRRLRKLYTEARQADAAWCLCQALHCMNMAEPDEERFFRRMRPETAAEARQRLNEDDWKSVLIHPATDPLVTAIFTWIEPAVLKKNAQPLETLGYQPTYALDLATHPAKMSQTLYYVGGVLGMEVPLTFQNPNDASGLAFLHGQQPAIVLGAAALADVPTQAAAFAAARHLTYYRPGYYIRQLVPTGTGLRAWLFAAIRMIHSSFPIARELEDTVNENVAAIEPLIRGPARDQLASTVSKLLQSGAIDLKRWVSGVDLTADRAGLLVSHDLEVACEMIRGSDESAAGAPQRERAKELTLFSIGQPYLELRKHLGISIDV